MSEVPAPAPHLADPEGCAALHIALVTVPRVSRSCEHFPDGFDLHLLHPRLDQVTAPAKWQPDRDVFMGTDPGRARLGR